MKSSFLLFLFGFLILGYVLFSFSLTAPNLILSSWSPYWQFQTYMWKHFFNDRQLLVRTFTFLITALWLVYGWFLLTGRQLLNSLKIKQATLVVLALSLPPILASNALSYDIFNYIFNAKMIMVYHVNPHQAVALDFAYDDWTRFMHNTHTPAPYGYGWSTLSLLPYALGLGKLLSTWLSFKAFSWISYFLLAVVYWHSVEEKNKWWSWLVLLNPLVLIETVGNSHNDLWMIVPAMAALLMVRKKISLKTVPLSLLLLGLSISIKLATVVVVPIWLIFVFRPFLVTTLFKKVVLGKQLTLAIYEHWAWLVSFGLFLPLTTERSKYFLPWYITWSLVWLPFFVVPKNKLLAYLQQLWQAIVVGFSISSLYRYLPFLSQGNYDGAVVSQQIMITWIGGGVIAGIFFICQLAYKSSPRSGRMKS